MPRGLKRTPTATAPNTLAVPPGMRSAAQQRRPPAPGPHIVTKQLLDVPIDELDAALEIDRAATVAEIARQRDAVSRVAALIQAVENADASLGQAAHREAEAESRWARGDRRARCRRCRRRRRGRFLPLGGGERACRPDGAVDFGCGLRRVRRLGPASRRREPGRRGASRVRGSGCSTNCGCSGPRGTCNWRSLRVDSTTSRAEIEALESGESVEPDVPPTRAAAPAESIPLWRAVSFEDQLDDASRAGLEAALEASGLLTATIVPDGSLRRVDDGQLVLVATDVAVSSRTLADVLIAEPPADSSVTRSTITASAPGHRSR